MPGKLKGVIAATTPSGWRIICSSMPLAMSSLFCPASAWACRKPPRRFRWRAAFRPCSRLGLAALVGDGASRSSRLASSKLLSLKSGWMRSPAGVRRQLNEGRAPRSTALLTSAAGREWHLGQHLGRGRVSDLERLVGVEARHAAIDKIQQAFSHVCFILELVSQMVTFALARLFITCTRFSHAFNLLTLRQPRHPTRTRSRARLRRAGFQ